MYKQQNNGQQILTFIRNIKGEGQLGLVKINT